MFESSIMNTYGRFDVIFDKGIGSKIYDARGREYIDFVSGVAVNCLGHSHPAIINAINEQSKKLIHISNYYWNANAMLLADKLIENSDHSKVFFCNSGTEAVETALKLSRKYGKQNGNENKNVIINMNNSFHGRTMGALSVTAQPKYQSPFTPLVDGIRTVKFNNIQDLTDNFDENVCAVIVEPVQGEGGIIPASKEFLEAARLLCDKFNSVLIFDEVQCGIGRLGSLFAYKEFGVIPDVICIAKGLGGGFPIGAIITNDKTSSVLVPGDHGSTFGGSPLACAVSLAVLQELIDNKVLDDVSAKSDYLKEKLLQLKSKYNIIDEIRGMGLLIGISINKDAKKFINLCFDKGLLAITAGTNVVRLLPPLNVEKKDIDDALKIIEDTLIELS